MKIIAKVWETGKILPTKEVELGDYTTGSNMFGETLVLIPEIGVCAVDAHGYVSISESEYDTFVTRRGLNGHA